MPFLIEIKDRITSTSDTKKITQSLELVAASKMRGFVKRALGTRAFASSLLEALQLLGEGISQLPYTEAPEEGQTIFILITSDKGLCGNLNQRLVKYLVSSPEWVAAGSSARVVTVGRKGQELMTRLGHPPLLTFPAVGEQIKPLDALGIVGKIIRVWEEGHTKSVSIICPHYSNPFVHTPVLKQFLPFSQSMVASHFAARGGAVHEQPEFYTPPLLEPDPERVRSAFVLQLIEALFTQSFYELKASEYASRMVAMKKASDAATDMIQDLTLEYNKARQAQITSQLAELATAAEAMS